MFIGLSLKTCIICYKWLLNLFSRIFTDLTLKPAYIGMCAKGQIVLEFSLMWIWVTCLLAFHMPWDRMDSTFQYPFESYIRNPLVHWKKKRELRAKKLQSIVAGTYTWVCIPLSLGALLCSSQDFLFLVILLLWDGGLRWWRPKWGIQFLHAIRGCIYLVISDLY